MSTTITINNATQINAQISTVLPIPSIFLEVVGYSQNFEINISYGGFTEQNTNEIKEDKLHTNEDNIVIKDELIDVKDETISCYSESDNDILNDDPYLYLNIASPISSISSEESQDETIINSFASEDEHDYLNDLKGCFRDISEIVEYLKEDKKCFCAISKIAECTNKDI